MVTSWCVQLVKINGFFLLLLFFACVRVCIYSMIALDCVFKGLLN